MSNQQMTQQKREKMQKELNKWKQAAAKVTPAHYLVLLVIILALVYITDEVTSNITATVQSSVVNEFFVANGVEYNIGLSNMSLMMMPAYVFYLILPFYKSLADRYGRKLFLVINTLGMALGMFVVMISPTIYAYILGCLIIRFFIPNDMQVMYIMEAAPEQHRAKLCSLTKACGYVGVSCISILRLVMMGDDSTKWHSIFIVPVILGVIVTILCIIFVKESPVFLHNRVSYLENELSEKNQETAEEKKEESKKEEGKTGVFQAVKYIFGHKQTRWLAICALIFIAGAAITSYYESIMTTGGMSTSAVTQALFVYPLANALFTLIGGVLTDRLGRKRSLATLCVISIVCLAAFIFSAGTSLNPYLIGAFYGIFAGCYWSVSDLLYLILPGESVPTRIRASVLGTFSLILVLGSIIAALVVAIGIRFVSSIGMLCMTLCIVFMALSVLIVLIKVKETKGIDLEKIGTEE